MNVSYVLILTVQLRISEANTKRPKPFPGIIGLEHLLIKLSSKAQLDAAFDASFLCSCSAICREILSRVIPRKEWYGSYTLHLIILWYICKRVSTRQLRAFKFLLSNQNKSISFKGIYFWFLFSIIGFF